MQLQQLVNDLANTLGISLLVEDREHRVVTYSPQSSDIDDVRRDTILAHNARPEVRTWLHRLNIQRARTPIRVPANEALNMLPRICVPVWQAADPLGYLWVIDTMPQSDASVLSRIAAAGSRIAAAWPWNDTATPLSTVENGQLVQHIWAGSPTEAQTALSRWRTSPGLMNSAEYVPVLCHVPLASSNQPDLLATARTALSRSLLGRAACTSIGRDVCIVLPTNGVSPTAIRHVLSQLHSSLEQSLGVTGTVRVGVGPAAATAALLQRSTSLARACATMGAAFDRPDYVLEWDAPGVHRAAYELLTSGMQPQQLVVGFDALLAADSDGVLLHTLERYLTLGCNARNTSAALSIHRTSLYYRLERASAALGCDLGDGTNRLELHLAVLLHRLRVHTGSAQHLEH